MENINDAVAKIRIGLAQVADAIETVAITPSPKPEFTNNEISGDKVHGGTISMFKSIGIEDTATERAMQVTDNGTIIDNIITDHISSSPTVYGDLTVQGLITAEKLHVNELTADVRNERSTPLEFVADDNGIYGKGLQWRGQGPTKQFIYRANPDRLYSTESIDIDKEAVYMIGNNIVLRDSELGSSIRNSSLVKVGTLQNLRTNGDLSIDGYIFYNTDTESLGLGTESPNGKFAVATLDAEFIIDTKPGAVKLGTWTSNDLEIITDDTTRLKVHANGNIELGSSAKSITTTIHGKLGIGVNNMDADVALATDGPIKIAGKKITSGTEIPTSGTFRQGDIVYNDNAVATGYVGWVCVREGTPGEWKSFGQISS
jgi:hypothetical protein